MLLTRNANLVNLCRAQVSTFLCLKAHLVKTLLRSAMESNFTPGFGIFIQHIRMGTLRSEFKVLHTQIWFP